MQKNYLRIGTVVLFLVGCGESVRQGALAVVGGRAIAPEEFTAAARKLSGEEALAHMDIAARRKLLEALVAEQLLVLEGERRGLGEDDSLKAVLEAVEREHLHQEWLARRVDGEDIEVSPEEIRRQYQAWGSGEEILLAHIQSRTEEEAREIMRELAEGADFARLARERSRHGPSALMGGQMGYVRRAMVPPEFRQRVWDWPVGQVYPEPIKTSMGYHVLKVEGRRHFSLEEQRGALEYHLKNQKKRARRRALEEDLRRLYELKWHPQTALRLAHLEAKSAIGDSALFEWKGGRLSAADFVRRSPVKRALRDTARLRAQSERLALEDLVVLDGRRRGYERLEEVRAAVEKKRRQWLGERLFALEVGRQGVDEERLRAFYEEHKDQYRDRPRVSIREILVDEKALADSLFALVAAGGDMAALARQYTQRPGLRAKDGMWEEVPYRDPRSARIYAQALESEGLHEPVKVAGGYSFFQVLDKEPGRKLNFDEVEKAVRKDVETVEMDRFIQRLRRRYAGEIWIDEEALEQLK